MKNRKIPKNIIEKLNRIRSNNLILDKTEKFESEREVIQESKLEEKDLKNKKLEKKIQEMDDILKMRKNWSKFIMIALGVILGVDILIIGSLGLNWISFEEGYFIPVFVGDSLIKFAGLSIIVVKFLFKDKNN
jgi:uncharacterized membrane protein YcjF (UPF0283 family)